MSKVYRHSDGIFRDYPESVHSMKYAPPFEIPKPHEVDLSKIKLDPGMDYTIETKHILDPKHLEEKKGLKFDSEKVPLDLIPYDALIEIGKVLQAGEKKYGTANWANGIEIRRLLAAAMRHIGQFNNGEDLDEETQTLHLANSATNLMFAIWMMKNRPDMDNRWVKGVKK